MWAALLLGLSGLFGGGRALAEDAGAPPTERSAIRARVFTSPPTIDGEIRPEEWPDDPESTLRLDRAEQVIPARRDRWKGPLDAHLVGRVGVDADALYLGISVTDDVGLHTGEPWHAGDSIEVFLNTDLGDDATPPEGIEPGYSDDDWQLFLMPWNPYLRWGVAYHGDGVRYDDGGLVGVRTAWRARGGGSYDLEVRLPFSNFPGLAGTAARRIGFDVALNDVDRFVPTASGAGAPVADPATYLTSRGKSDLYRFPGRFMTLEIPERPSARAAPAAPEPSGSAPLGIAIVAAIALVLALVGPGSRRLARAGPKPKAALLALDVLLAGFLALSSSCEERRARSDAQARLDTAIREAEGVAEEAAGLGALDAMDPAASSRTLARLLGGESAPCLPPVVAHAFVPLAAWPGDREFAGSPDVRIPLAEGSEEDWPLAAPIEARALRLRIGPQRPAGRHGGGEKARLAVLKVTTTDGRTEESVVETNLADGAGERSVRIGLPAEGPIARLAWRHEPGAPPAILAGIAAVKADGTEVPLALPTWTEDRVPVLARPGARYAGPVQFLGAVIMPRGERQFTLPALPGADRLWLAVAVERGFPVTRHGQEVAEVRVVYAVGEPSLQRLVNGDDVDEERLNQVIRHPADMRSRVAYRWTDDTGTPRHHDLVAVPLDLGRRPLSLRIKNLSAAVTEQGTGSLVVAAATLARHATDVASGRLAVAPDAAAGGDRAYLRDARPFQGLLATTQGDAVRTTATVGRPDRRATVAFSTPLPASVAERARRTDTALLTCLGIAAFLLVLLVVDFVEAFRRLSARLVLGVLAAALLPVAVTIVLSDRRNSDRLEAEREARVAGWLTAARNALLVSERQEAQVGAQGLLQLVTSLPDRGDVTRLRDQVGVYRRSGIVGGASAAVLVRGRDLGTISVDPEAESARIAGPAFLADHADASGLYVSPWDGLLLVATARSVAAEDWRKVVVGVRVDDGFVEGRVGSAIPDRGAEVAVVTASGEVAGTAGEGGAALGAALSAGLADIASRAPGRDGILISRLPTSEGSRLVVVAPLAGAASPGAPAAWLAVGEPRRALDAQIRTMREELVGLGLAAAILVACVAATLARRISGPIRDLVSVTEAVRRGEFDVVVPPPGTDEVGDLAVAFDQMRRDLKQRVGDLDFLRRAQERATESLDTGRTSEAILTLFRERWTPGAGLLLVALAPTGPVQVRAEHGRKTAASDRSVEPAPGGWLAAALAATDPIVIEDAAKDPRVAAEGPAAARWVEGWNAFAAIPLRTGGEVQGVAVLAWEGAATLPGPDSRALWTPLAGTAALALHNARLYRLAALDEATGLPGSTSFESSLRGEVDAALSGGPAAVVLRVGLDGLERVASRQGVEAARSLARAAADALRAAIGSRVQAGRLREDELAVRCPGFTRDEAAALAEAIRERLSAVEIRREDGAESLRTSVSVGIARCPDDAKSLEFLLDAAGRALAAARRDGGDRVVDVHRVDAGLVEVPPYEDGAVFRTERMVRVLETARRAARTDSTVLLTGETGVGKEVVADLIHRRSLRAEKPFIKVNTAAIPETLLESELFGHERGAFTGAERRREGRFELADGGTLFLDEVGEMPLQAQVKLLRVLAEGQFTRLGGTKPVDVDVRVVAATNQDLEKAVTEGRFREDLYYRLNVLRVEIPPLRDRREEIPSLVEHFLEDSRRRIGRGPQSLSPQAMDVLYRHPWPGNVRELRNVIERASVMCEEEIAGPEHLRVDPPRMALGSISAAPVAAPLDTLNERQRALLDHLAAHGRCTNREFIEMTQASERTGLRDLADLMRRGLIVREGKRRGAVYRLP